MMHFRLKVCVFFTTFCTIGFLIAPIMRAETVDKIVARVGGDIITLSDLAHASAQQRNYFFQKYGKDEGTKKFQEFSRNALEELILDRILRSEIKNEGCEPTESEVEQEHTARLQQMRVAESALIEQLSRDGISLTDYKDNIRYDMGRSRLIQKKIMPKITVSDYDLQKEYEKNITLYQTYNKFHFIEVFLTPDKFSKMDDLFKVAKQIYEGLSNKKPVVDLIKKYSSGAFAAMGGNSGPIEASQLRPEIQSALSKLKIGEVSTILPTQQGLFIFKLLAKSDPKPLSYSEVSAQVRSRYYDQVVNDELKKYLMAVKDQTFVEIIP